MTSQGEITIIRYGTGNVGSIVNMLRRLDIDSVLASTPETLPKDGQGRILIPGVGAFDHGIRGLEKGGLGPAIKAAAGQGTPVLGICLGMQLLTDGSAEGNLPGLGLIPGRCELFSDLGASRRVPHMGWNWVDAVSERQSLVDGDLERQRFYFAHSYYVSCSAEDVRAYTSYGRSFPSVIARENVLGAQFHPEKSHNFGMKFLENFSGWKP